MSGKNYFKTASDLTDEFVEKEIDRGNVIATKSRNGDYICNRCGGIVDIEGDTCPHCGVSLYQLGQQPIEIENVEDTKSTDELAGKEKRGRSYIIFTIVALALIAIIVGGGLSNRKTVIDLNQYVSIIVEGYDTLGTARWSFDNERFLEDYSGKLKYKSKGSDNQTGDFIKDCVSGALNIENELSNGDVLVFNWDCNEKVAYEKYGVNLQYSDISYEVLNLERVNYLVNINKWPHEEEEYMSKSLDDIFAKGKKIGMWANDEKFSEKLVLSYFLYKDPDNSDYNVSTKYNNYLFFVYEVDYETPYVDDYKYYWYGYYYNILRDSSGEYYYSQDNYKVLSCYNSVEDNHCIKPDYFHILSGYETLATLQQEVIKPLQEEGYIMKSAFK